MAELGCIASIIGIAALGVKISKTLYTIGNTTTGAAHNINRIATNVTLFSSILKHVGKVLQDANSLHSPEAIETVEQIVRECESVFQEITKIIYSAKSKGESSREPIGANDRRRRMSVVNRAKWYFEQPKVEHLLAQLEYLKTTLSVLIQTLNLAAVTAQMKEVDPPAQSVVEEVVREKLHVETLVVAQQISVNLLQESQEKYMQELEANPAAHAADKEMALEQQYPKLLTQVSQTSLQLVKLGDGNFQIHDRRPSENGEDGAPLEQTASRSDVFVDELLHRWTVPPPQRRRRHHSGRHRREAPANDDQLILVSRNASIPEADEMNLVTPRSGAQTPELQLQLVQSPEEEEANTGLAVGPPPPKAHTLDPKLGPPRSTKSPENTSRLGPHDRMVGSNALVRTKSNPESDGVQDLQSFQDHHKLAELDTRAQVNIPYFAPAPPLPQSFWSAASPAPNHAYAMTPYAPPVNPTSRRAARRNPNYKAPYVESESSSTISTDSEEERPRSKGNARRDSNTSSHKHKDSGVGEGLGIPWRITIGNNYFDFLDHKLVGPRTPYLPSVPIGWIQSHANARTIISKRWVNEPAIIDHNYQYKELKDHRDIAVTTHDEGFWNILQPLNFNEIEALVTRTLDSFRSRSSGPDLHPRSPQDQLRVQPGAAQRSVSFSENGPQPFSPGGQSAPGSIPWPTPPISAGPFSPTSTHDPALPHSPRTSGPDWRQKAHDRAHQNQERDRSHERWLEERDHRPRDRDRGSRRKHKHRDERHRDERHRDDRHREEEHDRKVKGSTMAGTLAKIGGLAALLEGIDVAF